MLVLERQLSLFASTLALPVLLVYLAAEGPMPIEMQHVYRSLRIFQTSTQSRARWWAEKLEFYVASFDLRLHLVEQFASRAARVDEACAARSSGHHEDA